MQPVAVAEARVAYTRGDWRTSRDVLERVRATSPLETDDLELLTRSTWWLGDSHGALALGEEVYRRRLVDGDAAGAALRALELALAWSMEGDIIIGQAWLNRARRHARDIGPSPVHGYLLYVDAGMAWEIQGDVTSATEAVAGLHELARQFEDRSVEALALVLSGMVAVWSGRTTEGFGDLDEAMLGVLAGSVPPQWAGDIYCTVIHLCHQLGDLARMRRWTDALHRWATPLSETFVYAGVTRIHQLQLLSAEGEWEAVEREIDASSRALIGAHGWIAAEGFIEMGDIRRLRGDRVGARSAYARAQALGVPPQPGEALLDEAEGRTSEALAGLRSALGEHGRLGRARILLPTVEVALRAGDMPLAESSLAELEATATTYGTPGLRAWADQAHAELLLHHRAWDEALGRLAAAAEVYRAQRCRYAGAKVHELAARAHRGRGDARAADAALATALAIHRRLGAGPDLARLEPSQRHGGLTEREAEVLALVAGGATNRDVAQRLFISDKTVSRHLANIFAKAGVSSRTAAAAWAYDQGIRPVRPPVTAAQNTP